jgi:hypothetical protein
MESKMDYAEYQKLVSTVARGLTNSYDLREKGDIKYETRNKWNLWRGVSGFDHRIDVSLANDKDVLLIECKYWGVNVPAIAFLTLWARIKDIEIGPCAEGKKFRGALVVSNGFQDGVEKLAQFYAKEISLFIIDTDGRIKIVSHTHFHTVSPIQVKLEAVPIIIIHGQ